MLANFSDFSGQKSLKGEIVILGGIIPLFNSIFTGKALEEPEAMGDGNSFWLVNAHRQRRPGRVGRKSEGLNWQYALQAAGSATTGTGGRKSKASVWPTGF